MNTLITKNSNSKLLAQEFNKYNSLEKKIFHSKSDVIIEGKKLQKLRDTFRKVPKKVLVYLEKSVLKEKIVSVKKMGVKSTFHVLFLIETKNKKYVLKINVVNDFFTDFSFIFESFIQKKMKALHLPSVQTFVDASRKYSPFDFLLMEYVKGIRLSDYDKGENEKTIYRKMGEIFKIVHSMQVEGSGGIDIKALLKSRKIKGIYKSWVEFFSVNLTQHITKSLAIGVIEKKEVVFIKNIFEKTLPKLSNKKLSLLHNDPGTRNIFTDGKSISGILDWEDAIIGDSLWEIAFIHTFLFRKEDEIKFKSFCKGYGIKTNELYSQSLYWAYYLRIALLKTISRNREGYYNAQGFILDKSRVKKAVWHLKQLAKE